MGANAAIYLPYDGVNLADLFEGMIAGQGVQGRQSHFEVVLNGESVLFNIMPQSEMPRHLQGFAGYIDSLDEPNQCKSDAKGLVQHTKTVLGMVAQSEFDENPALWQSLFQIADKWDGFVFVFDSVLLPNGGVIVGPLKESG
jgi:hypothetical protein